MFSQASVIAFVQVGIGGWLPSMHHWSHDQDQGEGVYIQERDLHPGGWADFPRLLQDTVNEWAVRILMECILVLNAYENSFLTYVMNVEENILLAYLKYVRERSQTYCVSYCSCMCFKMCSHWASILALTLRMNIMNSQLY